MRVVFKIAGFGMEKHLGASSQKWTERRGNFFQLDQGRVDAVVLDELINIMISAFHAQARPAFTERVRQS